MNSCRYFLDLLNQLGGQAFDFSKGGISGIRYIYPRQNILFAVRNSLIGLFNVSMIIVDQCGNLFGCLLGLFGQLSNFFGNNSKTSASLPALAASIAAFRANRLVCSAIPDITAGNIIDLFGAYG